MPIKVAQCSEIPDQKPFIVKIQNRRLCIIQSDGHLYCIEDHCPHQQSSLQDGTVEGVHLVCQYHGVEINLEESRVTNTMGFTNLSEIRKHRIFRKDEHVYVDLEERR